MEKIRSLFKRLGISASSPIYNFISKAVNFLSTIQSEGFFATYQIIRANTKPGLIKQISLRKLMHPFHIRTCTEDMNLLIQTAVREEYGHKLEINNPRWIIDAGAYIGDTAAYFLTKYKTTKVISLEPNPTAYSLAKKNLSFYSDRSILLNKGLSAAEGKMKFSGDFGGAHITDVGIDIDVTSLPEIVKKYNIPRINILKMDIEGQEELIFQSNPESWLSICDLLIIEIHGPEIERLILNVLKNNNFKMEKYRSVWYCYNLGSNMPQKLS